MYWHAHWIEDTVIQFFKWMLTVSVAVAFLTISEEFTILQENDFWSFNFWCLCLKNCLKEIKKKTHTPGYQLRQKNWNKNCVMFPPRNPDYFVSQFSLGYKICPIYKSWQLPSTFSCEQSLRSTHSLCSGENEDW